MAIESICYQEPINVLLNQKQCIQETPYDTYTLNSGKGEMCRFSMKRHKDGINGVFMDGHAEYIDIPRLWTLKWYRGFETRYDITIDW